MTTAASPERLPIILRPIRSEDLPLITDSWLRSFRESNFNIPHDDYMDTQRLVIRHLLGRSKAAIACDENDPDQIYGYAVWEEGSKGPLLHWMFVKHLFRRMGVGRCLWAAVNPDDKVVTLTHRSIHLRDLTNAGVKVRLNTFALLTCLVRGREKNQ